MERSVGRDHSLRLFLRLFVAPTVHVPDIARVAVRTVLIPLLLGSSASDYKLFIADPWDSVSIDRDLLVFVMELVQNDSVVLDLPGLQLLLSDARVVLVIIEVGLLDWNCDTGRHEMQALVQSSPQLGVFVA